jgi:hypothetical protein
LLAQLVPVFGGGGHGFAACDAAVDGGQIRVVVEDGPVYDAELAGLVAARPLPDGDGFLAEAGGGCLGCDGVDGSPPKMRDALAPGGV